ncbi:60S ribosomal protein L10 [Saguinus oedipus]|uniref:60S ribosomal protein L10 n=1 Tax=Saguinus oedipus TaxID=9490 RepID=A0ABQ9VKX2_SAGOE|nr:60S ribosomal protein L10 [Saguinus oedipus]
MFISLTLYYPSVGSKQACKVPLEGPRALWPRFTMVKLSCPTGCTKLQNKEHVIEALHRAKFKFFGRQNIHISKKWGFTKFNADEFEDMVAEKQLIPDGCGVKYILSRGPLDKWQALHS